MLPFEVVRLRVVRVRVVLLQRLLAALPVRPFSLPRASDDSRPPKLDFVRQSDFLHHQPPRRHHQPTTTTTTTTPTTTTIPRPARRHRSRKHVFFAPLGRTTILDRTRDYEDPPPAQPILTGGAGLYHLHAKTIASASSQAHCLAYLARLFRPP